MERFLLDNIDRYKKLVKAFKPPPISQVAKSTATSPNMVVSVRIRPLLDEDVTTGFPCAVFPLMQTDLVYLHDLYHHPRGQAMLRSFSYKVDRLFDSKVTTEEIYDNLVADLVPFAWKGGIGTLFAYGQTGSGKTFTVNRLEELVADSLLNGTLERLEGKREISMTIIELAGNVAYDLLNSRSPLTVLEDSFGTTQLVGVKEHSVQNGDAVIDLVTQAASFRRTETTPRNDFSSRSHAICRIRIHDPSTDTDGFLYLVDLAGSETARDVATHGAERMRETRDINLSLSVLKDCIRGKVLSDAIDSSKDPKSKSKKPHVPFRQSTLTKVLKHVFDPAGRQACKTVIIACLNPSLADTGPSKNTLRYAEMLRVLIPTTSKTESDPLAPITWTNTELKDWILKNSGKPPITSAISAPTETGAHFLRLSPSEIEDRCLKTPGVTVEQAKAFQSKLWRMHIDSQRKPASNTSDTTELGKILSRLGLTNATSSRDLNPTTTAMLFKERIRPGMVVSWSLPTNDTSESSSSKQKDLQLALILCPTKANYAYAKTFFENVVDVAESQADFGTDTYERWLCALVTPSRMDGAYELKMWQQIVISVNMMDKEVLLEYDAGTRYYHIDT
ncbi:kinesin motor domain-containing protein [Phlyctema vagabunda]|uniref:Kinesin motor domain-containing protein n=1 Tax=Phlyctema vagabunda TaxID=108571 RepID=A0ABR4P5B8_9HELO